MTRAATITSPPQRDELMLAETETETEAEADEPEMSPDEVEAARLLEAYDTSSKRC